MIKLIGNGLQAESIRRYHRHLVRLGKAGTLEQSARQWISKYAPVWRKHHTARPRAAAPPLTSPARSLAG